MIFGLCELELYLPECHSLKEKRNILRRYKYFLRSKYNISISEIEYKEIWKKSIIGIACVGDNRIIINKIIDRVINETEDYKNIELIDSIITNI